MASAFISYAHEDQEFVLALVEQLQTQGLDIRYDQIVLNVGDSLLRRIVDEITDGDFLVAIVSPDSVVSEWCQKEVSLAATQGINERRVKVLPVRFRGAAMPAMLEDLLWADADVYNVETVARRLGAAIRANMEGREEQAAEEAASVEPTQGAPAHGEVGGDVDVAQIDTVADRVWDVFVPWERMYAGGNLRDIREAQRRLRWTFDLLPDWIRAGTPLVQQLCDADWDNYFGPTEVDAAERDLREELRSVRTQVAQGLPVTRRWTIDEDLGQVSAGHRDAVCYLWQIRRGDDTKRIEVYISGTATEVANEHLPAEVAEAKDTHGRSVVMTLVALDDPPTQVMATTAGISLQLPA